MDHGPEIPSHLPNTMNLHNPQDPRWPMAQRPLHEANQPPNEPLCPASLVPLRALILGQKPAETVPDDQRPPQPSHRRPLQGNTRCDPKRPSSKPKFPHTSARFSVSEKLRRGKSE